MSDGLFRFTPSSDKHLFTSAIMTAAVTPKLFSPLQVGELTLQHRVVMAPLTRFRADKDHVHSNGLGIEYYEQRAESPGTLILSEGVLVAAEAGGSDNVPGIWSDAQIAAWKKVSER
jgi:NADPH2 dehydrogenase